MGPVVWFTGLPASGKSTLARLIAQRLREAGRPCCLLDSDDVRRVLVPPPDYSVAGRDHFYATLAGMTALLAEQDLVVLVAATAHRRAYRDAARERVGRFIEVHVATPLEECRERDPKGLYRNARGAAATTLPGLGARYEAPVAPEVVADGGRDEYAIAEILARLASGPRAAAQSGGRRRHRTGSDAH